MRAMRAISPGITPDLNGRRICPRHRDVERADWMLYTASEER